MRVPVMNRSLLMLCLALVAGLCAAWAARQHLQGKILQLEAEAKVRTVERVVAAYDLPMGTRINADHLAVRSFPATVVSSDSLPPERHSELSGTVLRASLRAGDTVLPAHTTTPSQDSFSSHLVSGRRAITMPVDAINSVSGLLQPGDLIDLYVSFEYQRRRITAPLLQGVLVLATGTTTQFGRPSGGSDSSGYATVTLDAAPEDAVKLVAARQSGTITAVLRHPQDDAANQKAVRGDLASLLGVNRPPPPANKRAPVIYGNSTASSVSRLLSPGPTSSQPSGLFELPSAPELVSAWLWASAQQDDRANGEGPAPFVHPAHPDMQAR
jgi:pilus assembly protein CpaB